MTRIVAFLITFEMSLPFFGTKSFGYYFLNKSKSTAHNIRFQKKKKKNFLRGTKHDIMMKST